MPEESLPIPDESLPIPEEPQPIDPRLWGASSWGFVPLAGPLPEQANVEVAIEEVSQLALENEVIVDDIPNVYLRVSARHLVLASSMFKAMLEPDKFLEGNLLHSQGNLALDLPGDPEALVILMHVIHGATRKVPRNITLDTLARLATLVDYYNLHEAVELFSETWVQNLKEKAFPKTYNPDVVPWLFISWVFRIEDAFLKITQLLICEGDNKAMHAIKDENIPIPSILSGQLQCRAPTYFG